MDFLTDFEKIFNDCCKNIALIIKEAIDSTEKDLGYSLSTDTKRIFILYSLLYIFDKYICK